MSDQLCEMARERIPDFIAGRLSENEAAQVEAHLRSCGECAAEAELVALLYQARSEPPEGLASRIQGAARLPGFRGGAGARPWWGLAAAAVAALALGIGVMTDRGTGLGLEIPPYVATAEDVGLWASDDGLIAGAPALEDLSEDALLTLLEEMSTGGAA
jgi:predicted anti-sigma-YlaC factor YlaD